MGGEHKYGIGGGPQGPPVFLGMIIKPCWGPSAVKGRCLSMAGVWYL